MALAFVNSRDFLTSNIIGATNIDQLKENIESFSVRLSSEILEEIEKLATKTHFLVLKRLILFTNKLSKQ